MYVYFNVIFCYIISSLLDLMCWDVIDQIEFINQLLLMIVGSKVDSLYMIQDVFVKVIGIFDK